MKTRNTGEKLWQERLPEIESVRSKMVPLCSVRDCARKFGVSTNAILFAERHAIWKLMFRLRELAKEELGK